MFICKSIFISILFTLVDNTIQSLNISVMRLFCECKLQCCDNYSKYNGYNNICSILTKQSACRQLLVCVLLIYLIERININI